MAAGWCCWKVDMTKRLDEVVTTEKRDHNNVYYYHEYTEGGDIYDMITADEREENKILL
jgi:hypothetical protein